MTTDRKIQVTLEKPSREQQIDFGKNSKNKRKSGSCEYWWQVKKGDKLHSAVVNTVRELEKDQEYHHTSVMRALGLYGSHQVAHVLPRDYARPSPRSGTQPRYNIVKAVTDTLVAHISRSNPRVLVLTDRGSYRQQRRAKLLSQFYFGLFKQSGLFDESSAVCRDAVLTGAGCVKVYVEQGEIKIERVFRDELIWNDEDAIRGKPRALYHYRAMSKTRAQALWPHAAAAIHAAPPPRSLGWQHSGERGSDLVEIFEAWYLRSHRNAKDGRHVLCVDGQTLVDEKYVHDYFPLVFLMRGAAPPRGLLPIGMADVLLATQVAINRQLDAMARMLRMLGMSRIYIPKGSQVDKNLFTNEIGAFIQYQGERPPMVDNSSPIPRDMWEMLTWLISSGFELAGISRLSVTGNKPQGLDSGKALREYRDIESIGISTEIRKFESFFVAVAKVATGIASELYANKVDITSNVPGSRFLKQIKWSEVCLDADAYVLSCFPTGMLPAEPAGRLAAVDEYVQKGYIGQDQAMQLLDLPDLERAADLWTAQMDDIDATIDQLLMGEPTAEEKKQIKSEATKEAQDQKKAELLFGRYRPDSMQALVPGIQRFRSQWLLSRWQDDVPEWRLQLLLDWIAEAEALLTEQAQTLGAMGGDAAAMGGAQDMNSPQLGGQPAGLFESGINTLPAIPGGVGTPTI